MSGIVFEIFTEELPATLQKQISQNYYCFVKKIFSERKIKFVEDGIFIGITLNRLVLIANNVEITLTQFKDVILTTLKEFSAFFPRNMSYPQSEVKWIRPIRNIFACIDDDILLENFCGINSRAGVYIDKFTFKQCKSIDEYNQIISDNNIILDYTERFTFIKKEIQKYKQDYDNNKLIEEIAGMSEKCNTPILCILEKKFKILPFELIELVLRENQRYVVFKKKENNNNEIEFLIFANKSTETVKKGHRVVESARLDDALFYWYKDENIKYDKEKLKSILSSRTFIDDISWQVYLHEQETLARNIIKDNKILDNVIRLIWDTKLDLVTSIVSEFTELQGIIGAYYFNYNFNPYYFDKSDKNTTNDSEILYYYLIDRLSYINIMYQQGKQPTGSGDKYKVKAKMDDVINIIFRISLDKTTICDKLFTNKNILFLYKKRLQTMIENNYSNIDMIKDFAKICIKLVDGGILKPDIDHLLKYYNDKLFIKVYKRITGYTKNVIYDTSESTINCANAIFPNNDILSLNTYLDKNNINNNERVKLALKFIEVSFFAKQLPIEFLEK